MSSVLSPVSSESSLHAPTLTAAAPMLKQDTVDYLADMLRELSAIAAWADLDHVRRHIEAALSEIETERSDG